MGLLPLAEVVVPPPQKPRDTWTEADVRGVICNPLLTGIGGRPEIMTDEEWAKGAVDYMERHGRTQFLADLLFVLREQLRV